MEQVLRTSFREYVLKEKLDFKKKKSEYWRGKKFYSKLPPTNN